eukprot:764262-Hanusia_phi.AAC.8
MKNSRGLTIPPGSWVGEPLLFFSPGKDHMAKLFALLVVSGTSDVICSKLKRKARLVALKHFEVRTASFWPDGAAFDKYSQELHQTGLLLDLDAGKMSKIIKSKKLRASNEQVVTMGSSHACLMSRAGGIRGPCYMATARLRVKETCSGEYVEVRGGDSK